MTSAHVVVAEVPPVAGAVGLVQGRYGAAGNLELVAPAADTGLWVFWFNADPGDTCSGALRREWSGGLHFGPDTSVGWAWITQMRAGPDFLEVLAACGTDVHRYMWTPSDGFADRGVIAHDVTSCSSVVESSNRLHLLITGGDGQLTQASADIQGYPDLDWRYERVGIPGGAVSLQRTQTGLRALVCADGAARMLALEERWHVACAVPGQWDTAQLVPGGVVGLAPEGALQFASFRDREIAPPMPAFPERTWTSVAAAPTTLDGGRTDVVAAADGQLWHLWTKAGQQRWCNPRRIVSRVWSTDPDQPVHRRKD